MDILDRINLIIEAKRRDLSQAEQRKILNGYKKDIQSLGLKTNINKYTGDPEHVGELKMDVYYNKDAYYDDSFFIITARSFDEVNVLEATGGWDGNFDDDKKLLKFLSGAMEYLKGESNTFSTKGF